MACSVWVAVMKQLKSINACFSDVQGFPCGSAGEESACNGGDVGSIHGLERSPGEGKGYPLQYSGLEHSMDCIVYGVAKSQTQLSDFHSYEFKDYLVNFYREVNVIFF